MLDCASAEFFLTPAAHDGRIARHTVVHCELQRQQCVFLDLFGSTLTVFYMPPHQLQTAFTNFDCCMLVSVSVLAVLGRPIEVPYVHVKGFFLSHGNSQMIATDLDRSISRDCIPLQWQATRRTGFVAIRLHGLPPATDSFNDDSARPR